MNWNVNEACWEAAKIVGGAIFSTFPSGENAILVDSSYPLRHWEDFTNVSKLWINRKGPFVLGEHIINLVWDAKIARDDASR